MPGKTLDLDKGMDRLKRYGRKQSKLGSIIERQFSFEVGIEEITAPDIINFYYLEERCLKKITLNSTGENDSLVEETIPYRQIVKIKRGYDTVVIDRKLDETLFIPTIIFDNGDKIKIDITLDENYYEWFDVQLHSSLVKFISELENRI